jgi:hypothetical protein
MGVWGDALVKLWAHEVLRVFYDRLVDRAEQEWFLGEQG